MCLHISSGPLNSCREISIKFRELLSKFWVRFEAWYILCCWKASSQCSPRLGVCQVRTFLVVLQCQLYFTGGLAAPVLCPGDEQQVHSLCQGPSCILGMLLMGMELIAEGRDNTPGVPRCCSGLLRAQQQQLAGAAAIDYPSLSALFSWGNKSLGCRWDALCLGHAFPSLPKGKGLCLWRDGTVLCPWFAIGHGSDLDRIKDTLGNVQSASHNLMYFKTGTCTVWFWALNLGPFAMHLPENLHEKLIFLPVTFCSPEEKSRKSQKMRL